VEQRAALSTQLISVGHGTTPLRLRKQV